VEITRKFPVTCRTTGCAHTQQWHNMHGNISHVMKFASALALAFHRSHVKFPVAGSEKRRFKMLEGVLTAQQTRSCVITVSAHAYWRPLFPPTHCNGRARSAICVQIKIICEWIPCLCHKKPLISLWRWSRSIKHALFSGVFLVLHY